MRINVVSESEFTVKGHGVHTAYIELTRALQQWTQADVAVNTWRAADITHLHTVGLYALARLLFGRGKKVVSAHVVPESFVGSLKGTWLWLPLARRYLRWFYSRASLVLAVSDETRQQLEALGVTSRIETFHNVVDTARYRRTPAARTAARRALGLKPDDFVVVGSGQVQPRKGIDSLVRVAGELPDMRFLWVGGMPFGPAAADYAQMKRLMDEPLPNLQFTGVVPLEAVRQYYHAADVFWLPSYQETFGMVVVEAAASGLPVLLRDIADYDYTFRGMAITAGEASFASALTRLRDDAGYYRHAVHEAAAIARKYDAEAGAHRLMALYEEILVR